MDYTAVKFVADMYDISFKENFQKIQLLEKEKLKMDYEEFKKKEKKK